MDEYLIQGKTLRTLADAVREKVGSEDLMTPSRMISDILAMQYYGGSAASLPELNSNYPQDVTVVEGPETSATFNVSISVPGNPAQYTYQWYVNGEAVSGATGLSYTKTGLDSQAVYQVHCEVTNKTGTVVSRLATLKVEGALPSYTFDGSGNLIDDGNGNWRIKFYSSGYFVPKRNMEIDVFLVGGGGAGVRGRKGVWEGPSGAGGKTTTGRRVQLVAGQSYHIEIGGGGAASTSTSNGITGGTGGTSSAFNYSATGGGGGCAGSYDYGNGGDGGSGGAGWTGSGGTDGGNGSGTLTYSWRHGYGQGSTTRAFGDSNGELYASGGSFGGGSTVHGGNNTGNGGSGGGSSGETHGGNGGSGIVIIRNAR